MAAPSSAPSPSSKPVEGDVDTSSKGEAATATNVEKPAASSKVETEQKTSNTEPTFEDAEKSSHYAAAKRFLQAGDFEQALTSIEEGIEATRNAVLAATTSAAGGSEADEDATALHEAMAPFHYLYGTTLLYSIEESSDVQMPTAALGAVAPSDAAGGSALDESGDADGDGGDTNPKNDDQHNDPSEEGVTDEMQIAFENLEAARVIMERMMSQSEPAGSDLKGNKSDKLKLDLAQVYLREGDLKHMNGHYEDAISDYSSCLRYREQVVSNQQQVSLKEGSTTDQEPLLDRYDRKIADVHYNLALVYMLQVAETRKTVNDDGSPSNPKNASSDAEKKLEEYRRRSFYHYVVCSKTLSGQIASLCNEDPAIFLEGALAAEIPKFKDSGESDGFEDHQEHPQVAGMKLKSLRKQVSALVPPEAQKDKVNTLRELLDEIQETIDEADASEKGVHEVSEMKAEISAAVAAQSAEDGEANTAEKGSGTRATTTIGFGSAAKIAESAVQAKPVMAVKKKKKRNIDETKGSLSEDSVPKKSKNE